MNKRLIELKKIYAQSQSFKDKFSQMPPGKARDEFIYQEAIKRPLPKLVPVEFTDPKTGIKVKYEVLPDYLSIDGIRVPLSPLTAQKIASYFGLSLPTAKMSKQIWDAADTKVKPTPMSSGAYINGKYYSPQEVVKGKIGTSDTSIDFNSKIDKEIEGTKGSLLAGHMKDLVLPDTDATSRTHAVGWYDPKTGKPIQGGNGITMHDLGHQEYASGTRLVGNFEFTTKDGRKIGPISMEELIKNKDNPDYKDFLSTISYSPEKLKTYAPKNDPSISAGKEGLPKGTPSGYTLLPQNEVTSDIGAKAKSFLTYNYGDQIPFQSNGKDFMARLEPHFHPIPPPNLSPEEEKKYAKPYGWHKGVTIYKKLQSKELNKEPTKETNKETPKDIPQKEVTKKDESVFEKIERFLNSIHL